MANASESRASATGILKPKPSNLSIYLLRARDARDEKKEGVEEKKRENREELSREDSENLTYA